MAVRRTAYLAESRLVDGGDGVVTVDVYVLWPPGCEEDADALLASAVRQIREQLTAQLTAHNEEEQAS